jgi:TFIIF-interacting CTD phosphatase-like protein
LKNLKKKLGKGVYLKSRPGLKKFLEVLVQRYELVVLSDDETMFLQSLITYLDPHKQKFIGAFGRECMVYSAGEYYKDLKYLNRDMKNVVLLESNSPSIVLQKENTIFIPNWEG